MSKRFWFLGLLTILGITLLAVGYRGIGEIKNAVKMNNPQAIRESPRNNATASHGKQESAPEKVQNTAGDNIIKPDSTPSGNAVQVEQGETGSRVDDVMQEGSGFFVEYRLERERSRGHQIEIAREIINNTNSDPDIRKKAQEQLYLISNNLQKELEVESLIRAKGYKDAVVFLEGKTVTVVIQSKDMNQEDAIKITDLVSRSTQVSPQNIVIIPKY
ncbi:SpoIIIAH-like family protein [Desulforamulus putei]|uniref:Stage III sporulation protein AH n=1 Tax=Desulforamulus putei DSM 12395 TaxID=1121429 RepID=A0A1M4UZM6_9FIRM|nr:SpoIIIAH-like family protein [Desulforamulus putei]SHE62201.1 stage III sporulation protein AH [Desulforamulus putei DSM 12395]